MKLTGDVPSLQVVLEGVRGEDFRSDVAVDDVSLWEGACPGKTSKSPASQGFSVALLLDAVRTKPGQPGAAGFLEWLFF